MLSFEDFLKDVSGHTMQTKHDMGLYRHLRFSRNNCNKSCFEIITWPYHLAFTSATMNFLFNRYQQDMFVFFSKFHELNYIEEQCVSVDSLAGSKKYSKKFFEQAINEYARQYLDSNPSTKADDFYCAIAGRIMPYAHVESEARQAAGDFDFNGKTGFFPDFHERNFDDYVKEFVWACHAVRWAMGQWHAK